MSNQTGQEDLSQIQKGSSIFSTSDLAGFGHSLGGAFVLNTQECSYDSAPVGEFSWGGAAGTVFFVDSTEKLSVIFMTQMLNIPRDLAFEIRNDISNIIYNALV